MIACATVIDEILPSLPEGMAFERLDFGLHMAPARLKQSLQSAIDAASSDYDTLILGYGLCSMAVIGLRARNCTLVIPRVDDCIAMLLGSGKAYREELQKAPGTYFLTRGWIEVNDTILDEYQRSAVKYGEERARRIMEKMLANYTRLVYINSGEENPETYRAYAQMVARQFNLQFEQVAGSRNLIMKMLWGPWDSDFLVTSPGQTVSYMDFRLLPQTAVNSA